MSVPVIPAGTVGSAGAVRTGRVSRHGRPAVPTRGDCGPGLAASRSDLSRRHGPDVTGSAVARRHFGAVVVPIDRYRVDASRPVAAPSAPSRRLRLTRRGRVVVRLLGVAVVLLVVLAGVLLDRPALAGPDVAPSRVTERVVLPGETLWQIAGEVAPRADRRETVQHLMDLNALSTASVTAGQRLDVPVGGEQGR